MKRQSIVGLLIVFLLSFTAAGTANAEDFTFKVNLNVSNLLPRTRPIVSCSVYQGSMPIGRKSSRPLSTSNGSRSGTVTIKFNVQQGKNSADANRYRCDLRIARLSSNPFSDSVKERRNPTFVGPAWARAKSGTELVTVLEGSIE